jgi:quercetin dioxygenase-like cupin family protein
MSIVAGYELAQMVGDPDDHRPGTWWAVLADPGDPGERVDDLVAIVEQIGIGERIPLHVHRVSEVIFAHGPGEQRLGDERRLVSEGDVVFVPAGVPHGLANTGRAPLRIEAVFPSDRIWLRYLERNPAPGTEAAEPSPPVTFIVRTGEVIPDAAPAD